MNPRANAYIDRLPDEIARRIAERCQSYIGQIITRHDHERFIADMSGLLDGEIANLERLVAEAKAEHARTYIKVPFATMFITYELGEGIFSREPKIDDWIVVDYDYLPETSTLAIHLRKQLGPKRTPHRAVSVRPDSRENIEVLLDCGSYCYGRVRA